MGPPPAGVFAEQPEEALSCLELALSRKSINLSFFMKVNPFFDPLRGDRRFQAILEGMGLAD